MKLRLSALVYAVAVVSTACAASSYSITAQYPVHGVGTYGYIRFDASNQRLYVTHQTKVEVLDAKTGKLIGQVTGLHGARGVAIADNLHEGYITNSADGTVTVFNLQTLATLATIKTGGTGPSAIEYEPFRRLLLVSNGNSQNVTEIDANSRVQVALIPLAGNPASIGFDGQGHALVDEQNHNSVAQVDLMAGRVIHDWSTAPGKNPTGLAIDRVNHRAFVTCSGNAEMVVLSTDSGSKLAALMIGEHSDGAAFDPITLRAFSSNRDGSVSVIQEDDCDHFRLIDSVRTVAGAKTMALDPDHHRLYLPVAQCVPNADSDHPGPIVPDTFRVLVVE